MIANQRLSNSKIISTAIAPTIKYSFLAIEMSLSLFKREICCLINGAIYSIMVDAAL
jgi:hypothetical protein